MCSPNIKSHLNFTPSSGNAAYHTGVCKAGQWSYYKRPLSEVVAASGLAVQNGGTSQSASINLHQTVCSNELSVQNKRYGLLLVPTTQSFRFLLVIDMDEWVSQEGWSWRPRPIEKGYVEWRITVDLEIWTSSAVSRVTIRPYHSLVGKQLCSNRKVSVRTSSLFSIQ